MSGALASAVREIEEHAAKAGWDVPARLYALVQTTDLLAREPHLSGSAAHPELSGHLTAVEQEGLPEATDLRSLLEQIAWPPEVDGAAIVVERVTGSESDSIPDPSPSYATTHLAGEELRLVVGVLRDGTRAAALRFRSHDSNADVLAGEDLAPELADALATTLT
jgi:hypothetical protein